jgi:hypothetical protein
MRGGDQAQSHGDEDQPPGQGVEPLGRHVRRDPGPDGHQRGDPRRVGHPDQRRPDGQEQERPREAEVPPGPPEIEAQEGPDQANAFVARAGRRDLDREGRGPDDEVVRPTDDARVDQAEQGADDPEGGSAERLPEPGRGPTREPGGGPGRDPRQQFTPAAPGQRYPEAGREHHRGPRGEGSQPQGRPGRDPAVRMGGGPHLWAQDHRRQPGEAGECGQMGQERRPPSARRIVGPRPTPQLAAPPRRPDEYRCCRGGRTQPEGLPRVPEQLRPPALIALEYPGVEADREDQHLGHQECDPGRPAD